MAEDSGRGLMIARAFLAYMAVVGLAAGWLVAARPEALGWRVPPFFWVLLAMAAFEGTVALLARNASAPMISMAVRLAGFALGVIPMLLFPLLLPDAAR